MNKVEYILSITDLPTNQSITYVPELYFSLDIIFLLRTFNQHIDKKQTFQISNILKIFIY